MSEYSRRDARRARSRSGLPRHVARHATAAVLLAALAAGCGGSDSPSAPGGSSPFVASATNVPLSIPDSSGPAATSYLTVSGAPTSITKVTVKLSISHSYVSDLYISLFSPSGTEIALSNNNGGSGANYRNTVFDDSASIYISSAGAPFTGTYRPQWPLAGLDGENADGTWRLEVADFYPGYTGTIDSWSVQIW